MYLLLGGLVLWKLKAILSCNFTLGLFVLDWLFELEGVIDGLIH